MVEAGYFTLEEFLGLRERGIVGDVCCHFLDAEGKPRYPELSERIVGLTPDELLAIEWNDRIATGAEKAPRCRRREGRLRQGAGLRQRAGPVVVGSPGYEGVQVAG